MNYINQRVAKIIEFAEQNRLNGILITKPENIYYLSGFTGGRDGKLFLSRDTCAVITDGRYIEQAGRQCPEWLVIEQGAGQDEGLKELGRNASRLGVESHDMTHAQFVHLQKLWSAELIDFSEVDKARLIKDPEELEAMRACAAIGDRAFKELCAWITQGVSERAIANMSAFQLKENGCEKESFDIIALSGANAALPHGHPSEKKLLRGDMLILDFGGFYNHYAGDMTRTLAIGEASARLKEIYARVEEAQLLGLETVKAGVKGCEIDARVRNYFRQYDLDAYFCHSVGHGLGLEIHEPPALSARNESVLLENMVVTIEPGLYIPGWGGIRIEDTVIVNKAGCEIITGSNKQLITI